MAWNWIIHSLLRFFFCSNQWQSSNLLHLHMKNMQLSYNYNTYLASFTATVRSPGGMNWCLTFQFTSNWISQFISVQLEEVITTLNQWRNGFRTPDLHVYTHNTHSTYLPVQVWTCVSTVLCVGLQYSWCVYVWQCGSENTQWHLSIMWWYLEQN